MKKILFLLGISIVALSCNQKEQSAASGIKTAYVDTAKLFEQYTKVKELETKYKTKSEEMGKDLDNQYKQFQAEVQIFQKSAPSKAPAWIKEKQAELMAKEQQLQQMQQSLGQSLQQESAKEMDSLYKDIKKYIGDYGKKNGYTYIYGTGEAPSILYGKEELNITDIIVKELNKK